MGASEVVRPELILGLYSGHDIARVLERARSVGLLSAARCETLSWRAIGACKHGSTTGSSGWCIKLRAACIAASKATQHAVIYAHLLRLVLQHARLHGTFLRLLGILTARSQGLAEAMRHEGGTGRLQNTHAEVEHGVVGEALDR